MLGEPRIGLKPLAALCRRLATSLGAGVDVRTVWAREAAAVRGPGHGRFSDVSTAVAQGTTIGDALKETGNYFPEFFRELVRVGEECGHLPEVFRQLAEHYEHQLKLRRLLLTAITWPVIELTLALTVIGLLIWLMGAVDALKKANVDPLGLGLAGNSGLVAYLSFLAVVGAVGFFTVRASMRGVFWVTPVQHVLMAVPRLGRVLETFAIARLAWALHVTLNSGMDLRPALKMSLASTRNVFYTRHIDGVLAAIRSGREIHEALRDTGVFPLAFLDSVRVGEESGQLPESMGHLSLHYQEEARMAMNTLTILLGLAVWGLIAAIIIFFIFRLAGFYVNLIDNVSKGKF
ncbi:MAG: type II secretion system F family protein [Planctomycetia bacterium]|nr:type II secretion system F family protein [Planctomycetia bacterium]